MQASYYIFDKLTQEGFSGMDDVRLRTSIKIPKSMVGRVIGKGGKNVSNLTYVCAKFFREKSKLAVGCQI